MDLNVIGTSVLAGGIVGQILTLFGSNYLTNKREYKKWRLAERHKASTELLDIVTSNPQNLDELSQWTHKIRNSSMKVHILYKNGTAPKKLDDALEAVFKRAQSKKDGSDDDTWSSSFRTEVSELRKQLSNSINHD
ncbi:hypothetical protein [Photobacterium sagamiensis]|uniref:hypothetical protein n=1 Tax=Photobacterium sagamiensis TaxID=2910241 RepID=UPI003D0A786E